MYLKEQTSPFTPQYSPAARDRCKNLMLHGASVQGSFDTQGFHFHCSMSRHADAAVGFHFRVHPRRQLCSVSVLFTFDDCRSPSLLLAVLTHVILYISCCAFVFHVLHSPSDSVLTTQRPPSLCLDTGPCKSTSRHISKEDDWCLVHTAYRRMFPLLMLRILIASPVRAWTTCCLRFCWRCSREERERAIHPHLAGMFTKHTLSVQRPIVFPNLCPFECDDLAKRMV